MEENNEGSEPESQPVKDDGTGHQAPDAPSDKSKTPISPAPESQKEPSQAGRFFRTLLIWLGVIAVAFLAGVGTYHFMRYAPVEKTVVEAQSALDEANSELTTLRSEKQKADDTISALQADLDIATTHVEILKLLADSNEARLALIKEDVEAAKTALENSTDTLDGILPLIAEMDPDLAQSISQRLGLILAELERDPESAQVDLELLTKDLLAAEDMLSQ
jgi:peptidoglycan hydrolase CwlO-like protein